MLQFVQCGKIVIKVVFDTTIYLRAIFNERSRWGRLVHDEYSSYQLFVSIPILRETLDVITRPELVRKYRGLEGQDIKRILAILSVANVVTPVEIPPICRDPKDDVFIATAVAAGAAFLVSEDRDLLDIGEYGETRIVDTEAFLAFLDSKAMIPNKRSDQKGA